MTSSLTFFNNLFDDFLVNSNYGYYSRVMNEEGGGYKIALEVPGFTKEDLKIEINSLTLTIIGEKNILDRTKRINQSYRIPKNIDLKNSSASVEDGILYVDLKMKEEKEVKRFIEIR